MDLMESFVTAMDALRANKMRSILTMLGVIIGVAAVIALMSIGRGFSAYITEQIQSVGTNLIFIAADTDVSDGAQTLSLGDVRALQDPANTPHVIQATGAIQDSRQIVYAKNTKSSTLVGVTPEYFTLSNLTEMARGELFTMQDVESYQRVVVLGYTLSEDLFGTTYPIGRSVKIAGADYKVVGVLAEKGGQQGGPDNQAFMPLNTMRSHLASVRTKRGEQGVHFILAQATSEKDVDTAMHEITRTLRQRHEVVYAGEDDFQLISQTQLLSTFGNITATITLFLGAIAGVSLLVGGIGIMNIMLVSVTERTKEIGIRKAIGALRRDILTQFLIEALMLSLVGGAIGVVLGWAIGAVLGPLIEIEAVMDAGIVGLATGFAAAVGLIFGIYPAWRAARLRPIEALRYE
jgi:putative ABC transport system permease protein